MRTYTNTIQKVRRIILLCTATILISSAINAQITKEQADEIVNAHLTIEQLSDFAVYFNVNSPSDEALEIKTTQNESVKIKYACYAYFLKETDNASEPSRCSYLFVKNDYGNLLEIITNNDLGPEDMTYWLPLGLDDVWVRTFLPYPNPVDDWLNIPTKGVRTTIQVFDLNGRLILSETVSEKEVHKLNVSLLSAGTYVLNVSNTNETVNYKFIKSLNF